MNDIQMKIAGKTYNLTMASSWKEISRIDWLRIAPILKTGTIYHPAILSSLVKRKGRLLDEKFWDHVPTEGLYPLYQTLDWLKEDYCIDPPFTYIRIGRKKYHLPASRLANIPVVEFAFIDMCMVMINHLESQKRLSEIDEWIDRLCAYMCRPFDKRINTKDPDTYRGDRRERFNPDIISQRLPLWKKVDPRYKLGCLWFVIGCKRYIHNHYRGSIFPATHTEDGQQIIGREVSGKVEPMRWMNVIRRLSGGKFGDIDSTRFANLYDVLDELRDQIKRNKS